MSIPGSQPNNCIPGCQPNNLYRGGLPIKNLTPTTDSEATCVYNLLGLNASNPCYSDCAQIPIPCYGYALNIITPGAWTYPGLRGVPADKIPEPANLPNINNCSQLKALTEQDGSIYVGGTEPTNLSPGQHVFAAYATNFPDDSTEGQYHYIRKDTDTNTWSSKNGPYQPTQQDSNGKTITDPETAYFTLEGYPLTFCGYYVTSNDLVCPTDTDCVQGYQKPQTTGWPGCGEI
ncbi:MAG: hypothetical protein FJZ59_07735 [Chlamydiae bacterium]|nr:hypothetical protein [Chlamydiota bacterium]